MKNSFSEGLHVYYKQHFGTIRFVCDEYITICINESESRFNDVCLLVPSSEFDLVQLKKQSEK